MSFSEVSNQVANYLFSSLNVNDSLFKILFSSSKFEKSLSVFSLVLTRNSTLYSRP